MKNSALSPREHFQKQQHVASPRNIGTHNAAPPAAIRSSFTIGVGILNKSYRYSLSLFGLSVIIDDFVQKGQLHTIYIYRLLNQMNKDMNLQRNDSGGSGLKSLVS